MTVIAFPPRTVTPDPPPNASPDAAQWLYRQIIRMHTERPVIVEAHDPATHDPWPYPTHRGGCAHCPQDGGECRYLVWARAELTAVGRTPTEDSQATASAT